MLTIDRAQPAPLKEYGMMVRRIINQMTGDISAARQALTSDRMDPNAVAALFRMVKEIDRGTGMAEVRESTRGQDLIMKQSTLQALFPDFNSGPVVPPELAEEIVEAYRKIGMGVIAALTPEGERRLYFEPNAGDSFAFTL